MICRCFSKTLDLSAARRAALQLLGVPDYDAYIAHLRSTHPDLDSPTRWEFHRARQSRDRAKLRCC
jgi:uncharacterized short protein YbdD (DUF466 family)